MLDHLHFIPKNDRFFNLFDQSAANMLESARLLVELLEQNDVERLARAIKDLEHRGDEITRDTFLALNRTFVTPLDREDISALAAALDDVTDWIEQIARRMRLYRVPTGTRLARQFGRVLLDQVEQLAQAVPLLDEPRHAAELRRAAQEVHRLENEADDLLADAVAALYDGVTSVPQFIEASRWGDLYQLLEGATDKAEHVAVVLQNVAIKQA